MNALGKGSNGWACSIDQNWTRGDFLKVYVWKSAPGKRGSFLLRPGATGFDLVFVPELQEGPGPTLELPVSDLGMLEAIAAASQAMGLEGTQDERRALLEGKVEAQGAHLSDVRALLFASFGVERP